MSNTVQRARARAYLSKLPPAIAGSGGSNATFAAACRLVEFGLNETTAWTLLLEWNRTHCQPPWTEAELRHKLADAFKKARPQPRYTNAAPAPARPAVSPMSGQRTPHQNAPTVNVARRFPAEPAPTAKTGPCPEIVKLSARWREGTAADVARLAGLRGLSLAGVALASRRGLLRFGSYFGKPAWFAVDSSRRNGCARRMDGAGWIRGVKAMLFPDVDAHWPVGLPEARAFPIIMLCEGAGDLLAAHHFIATQHREAHCAAVAMLSAHYTIPPDALPLFMGRRVRIFPHADQPDAKGRRTGLEAARRWHAQLVTVGAHVDAVLLEDARTRYGGAVKDLNDFAHAEAAPDNARVLARLLP